jgi:protein-tyrosine phosphatase
MPGRLQSLTDDLADLQAAGIGAVLSLTPMGELARLGVDMLPREAQRMGLRHHLLPIEDFGVADAEAVAEALWFVDAAFAREDGVLVHCRAGIGRSGMLAATILVHNGAPPEEAITVVRRARPGAMETEAQERFVRRFGAEDQNRSL